MLGKFTTKREHHVDAMLCRVPAGPSKSSVVRSHSLRVRLGMVTGMAKIIEFYVPAGFRKKVRWIPADQRGKVLPFPAHEQKSA